MERWSASLLEFGPLKSLIARYLSSPAGHTLLEDVHPDDNRAAIEASLRETTEAIAYWQACLEPQTAARGAAIRLRFDGLPDVTPHTGKLGMEGAVLEGKEILDLTGLLDRASGVRSILNAASTRYPLLGAHASRIGEFRPLLNDLTGKILPDGSVADHASVALGRIRRDLERQQRLIQESLERFLRSHRDDGVLQEDFVTIRNERFVVPVVSGQKKKIDGVIHAASGTGHTLFIEPFETVGLNNDLVRLREQELREVHRILAEMTSKLREAAAEIAIAREVLALLDFLFAKARFAADFRCVVPRFSPENSPRLALARARHPLLEDVLHRQSKSVVPLSLTLESSTRTLLISGPNTGGKTVALKTIGLFALMAQSALPVPCEVAELPLFEQVLADIGDNQSIEHSLSTFSAHIARVKEMLELAGPHSLVLLDELGRATDPDEGGALGVAIVDHCRRWGAFTLASTHLVAPKIYGANTEGVLNGSMSFNEATLEPTYHLRTGAPGSSAGLDIAHRLGLPSALIDKARQSLSSSQRDLARFLQLMEQRLDEVTARERELSTEMAALETERAGLKQLWEKREKAKLEELETRADKLLAEFQKRAGETIDALETSARARQKAARERREFKEEFQREITAAGRPEPPQLSIREGARVRLKGVSQPATVRRLLGEEAVEVEAGFMKLQVERADIVEVLPETATPSRLPKNVTLKAGPDWNVLTREINIIGKRAEEACGEVDKFLDKAMLAGVGRVRIVHGHGMGILKRAVAELLSGHAHVESFQEAGPEEGGAGATIALLRQ
ncbi:MAG: endonuclease MutS2 [Acidimicrobiia bacterium]|nr:endonuclease MutS2 [Acidimicrobiia bacterium]